MKLNQLLEDLKIKYEEKQKFETIDIEKLPLTSARVMISFIAIGTNDKKVSLFSLVCEQDFPIRLISSDYNKSYEETELNQLTKDVEELISRRVSLLKKDSKNNNL